MPRAFGRIGLVSQATQGRDLVGILGYIEVQKSCGDLCKDDPAYWVTMKKPASHVTAMQRAISTQALERDTCL